MNSTKSLQKDIEVPEIFNGSHKRKQLGPATYNADIFLQQ